MIRYPVPLAGTDNTLMWADEAGIEEQARAQLRNIAALPWTHGLRVMPDLHYGIGATVGSVIAMEQAVTPAAVGVDIGCGMTAVRTTLRPDQLPDDLGPIRAGIERAVPVGFAAHRAEPATLGRYPELAARYRAAMDAFTSLRAGELTKAVRTAKAETKAMTQVGTLGGGNHFIELCLDESDAVWVMLHSGSRGTGNLIGTYFIERAREELGKRVLGFHVPDKDLAFFMQGEPLFDDYVEAVSWAQDYARENREAMMARVLHEMRHRLPKFQLEKMAVNCHHNYVQKETHAGVELLVTRKGAVSARAGELGIIPGSMGAKSFIVRGLGNADSFHSCSHGAGRVMSRTRARQEITLAQHREATAQVECRKDAGVIDESPAAYKDIDAVMAAQSDLVEIVHTLRQMVCIKG